MRMRRLCKENDLGKNKQKMAEKNIKSAKKEEKTIQTPQIPPKTLKIPSKNKEILEEPQVDEPEETHGLVECKHCKKDVEPHFDSSLDRWKCPSCNLMVHSPLISDSEQLKEVKPSKDRPYEILSARKINFSGNELAQAEMLIESGVASNFNDLAKKAFNLIFIKEKLNKAFGDNINMEKNNEPDPERTMKQLQQQDMMKAYIESMKSGNQTDPLQMMMLMRMMDNKEQGKDSKDNGMMNKILEMQMMKSLMGNQGSEMATLQRELADMKHQASMYQVMTQQQQTQQGNQMSQEYMVKMETLKTDRDKEIKKIEIQAQQQRDENIQLMFDSKLQQIQTNMEKAVEGAKGTGKKANLEGFKEQFQAVKEMSQMIGDKEKTAGEVLGETLGAVAEKAMPVLQTLAEQRRQQQMYTPQQQFPPEPVEQVLQPMSPQQQENPEQQSEMSPSEQDMSNTMERMYLKPSGKKE